MSGYGAHYLDRQPDSNGPPECQEPECNRESVYPWVYCGPHTKEAGKSHLDYSGGDDGQQLIELGDEDEHREYDE